MKWILGTVFLCGLFFEPARAADLVSPCPPAPAAYTHLSVRRLLLEFGTKASCFEPIGHPLRVLHGLRPIVRVCWLLWQGGFGSLAP